MFLLNVCLQLLCCVTTHITTHHNKKCIKYLTGGFLRPHLHVYRIIFTTCECFTRTPYILYTYIVLHLLLTIIIYLTLCHMWPARYIITRILIALRVILYIKLTSPNSGTLFLKVISVRVWDTLSLHNIMHTNYTCMAILYEHVMNELILLTALHVCYVKNNYYICSESYIILLFHLPTKYVLSYVYMHFMCRRLQHICILNYG